MKVIIRCDANIDIATGHMKRCLNIASELEKVSAEVIFAVASDSSADYVKDKFRIIKFDNEYNEPDIELEKMIEILKREKPELVLIDSYFVSAEYMAGIRPYAKTAYIDDLYERVWPADIIINYGIIADSYPYKEDYKDSIKLLGPKYMPINPVYKDGVKCIIKEKAKNVLIVSGGSDENHVMLGILKCIAESCEDAKELKYTFICGAFNKDLEEMQLMADKLDNISVMGSIPNLVGAISDSDIIVTAGGTTLYEMAIMGCPGIIYKIADNQSENINGFVKKEIALYAGDVRYDFSYEKLINMIVNLANNYKLRKQLSDKGKEIIDADGAKRLAMELVNNGKND